MMGKILGRILVVSILFASFVALSPALAISSNPTGAPPELEQWSSWVLHGMEEQACPAHYNDGQVYQCIWPSRLELFIEPEKGRFSQQWLIFTKGWVSLPGGHGLWPEKVKLNGKSVPVMNRNSVPSIHMMPGQHTVKGIFSWNEMPEMIQVPAAGGLVNLSINGHEVNFPVLDPSGRLWLQKREKTKDKEDRLEVHIHRRINDTIPMKIIHHLNLNVSGQAREIKLNEILLQNTIPMQLKSLLPARMDSQGSLMIQARPGRWEIEVVTRFEGPVHEIGPVKGKYGQEIWAFQSRNQYRMVKIKGVPTVDPGQTDIPPAWKNLPTYIVDPGSRIIFEEIRRGDPDPAPDRLHLFRTWWLDFEGSGFTIQDKITGTLSRQWYLAMNPPGILGRVSVDGSDQLITAQGEDAKPGMELRRGNLNLVAESRFEASIHNIPAVGWDHDFESVSGVMNLPPGWRLLTASGVDVLPGTWFQRWTLLDFFVVLIIAMAIFKLRNVGWGCLALLTLILTYHEPGSPRLVWLNLLAAAGLLHVLPQGWAKRMVKLWRLGAVVTLLVLSLPFMVQQIRWGMYPQLEPTGVVRSYRAPSTQLADKTLQEMESMGQMTRKHLGKRYPSVPDQKPEKKMSDLRKKSLLAQDPNALIQTGPGLPTLTWRSMTLKWNGPVDRTQQIRLWLLSPSLNLVLALLRVMLLAVLIFGMTDLRQRWRIMKKTVALTAIMITYLMLPGMARAETSSMAYPSSELLQELQGRLLKKPDCLPHCADVPRMDLNITPHNLRILLDVHAAVETAIPLPGTAKSWLPEKVFLDDHPAKGLSRDPEGSLWMLVPQGLHSVTLTGKTVPQNTFQIPLPIKPHHATVTSEGWNVQGVHQDGRVESGIQLTRLKKERSEDLQTPASLLPPYLHVERVLSLGLTWQVFTSVKRITPTGVPVALSIPLIPGESVTTSGITVEKSRALVHMDSKTERISWISTLEKSHEIQLHAPKSVPWTETWILDANTIWHCNISGIPVIYHQDEEKYWRPRWRPWPDESVTITVSKPLAIPGRTVTIDSANLELTPGRRFNKAVLSLTIRTSQGGQHEIILPDAAKLQQVKINGKSQPIRQEGQTVRVPLKPGSQRIYLEWNALKSSDFRIKGPRVRIEEQAVNAKVTFHMPRNRWILWTAGPRLGPAVLFWSYLIVVLLAATGLGRISWTPLKTGHWLLLSLGLTQVKPIIAIMIAGWLLALGLRKKHMPPEKWFSFNATQLILMAWTLAALSGLYLAIEKGLLGIPNMQISGNGSNNFHLYWTQDRIGEIMPQPWVLSLPQLLFHLLMLIWAIWLALSLLKWLKWGWECFGKGGLWKKPTLPVKKQAPGTQSK